MKFARRRPDEPTINLTSLIDIVFLLLIFFMVSTRFIDEAHLSLTLPAASQAASAARDDPIEVIVDARNRYYVGGAAVAAKRLAAALHTRHVRHPDRSLVLRADGQASHQAVVRVLDVAAAQGFERVDIAARPQER